MTACCVLKLFSTFGFHTSKQHEYVSYSEDVVQLWFECICAVFAYAVSTDMISGLLKGTHSDKLAKYRLFKTLQLT